MFTLKKDYNESELRESLKKLKIKKQMSDGRMDVITEFDNRTLNIADMSAKYGIFNFGEFLQELLTPLTRYFTIEKYDLVIYGAIQELRLYSKEFVLNDKPFRRILSVISSSDGSVSLQMNVGLSNAGFNRRRSFNYFYIGDDERISIRTKHFKNSVKENATKFINALPYLGVLFTNQEKILEAISATKISVKEFGKRLAFDDTGKKKVSLFKTFEKLFYLVRDDMRKKGELNTKTSWMSADQFLKSEFDIEYNSYDLLDKYSSIFSNKNSTTVARETKRAYNIINKIKIDYVPLPNIVKVLFKNSDNCIINPANKMACPAIFDKSIKTFKINSDDFDRIGLINNKKTIELQIVENKHTAQFNYSGIRTNYVEKKKDFIYSTEDYFRIILTK